MNGTGPLLGRDDEFERTTLTLSQGSLCENVDQERLEREALACAASCRTPKLGATTGF